MQGHYRSDCPNFKDYGENSGGKNNYSKNKSFSRHETKFRPKAEKHLQKMVAAIASGLQSAVDLSDIDSDQSGEDDPPSPKGKDTKKKKADRLTGMCFMAHEADEENDNTDEVGFEGLANKWLIDSGCSRHMTGDTKWFASLCKASGDEKITFGNDAQGCIVSKGTVRVN